MFCSARSITPSASSTALLNERSAICRTSRPGNRPSRSSEQVSPIYLVPELVYFELHLLLELYPLLLLNHHPVQIVDLRFRPADKGNAGIGVHSVVDRTLLRVRTLPDATFPRALLRGSATAHPRQIAIVCARLGS